jgi:hypothetical protein
MFAPEQKHALQWWARGDIPVHEGDARVRYFVDGRSVMFALCCAFLKARSSLSGKLGNDSRVGTGTSDFLLGSLSEPGRW